jgi:cytochrome d ubiquinol oxidase subunit I
VLIGWPDEEAEKNHFEIGIPGAGSWINVGDSSAVLQGLDAFPKEDRPPVWLTFWAFRVMVGLGTIMLVLGLWGAVLWALRKVDDARLFQRALVLASPAGFVAVIAGWVTAEVGRQPWIVYGVIRTADAVSPVPAGSVAASLLVFIIAYAIIFAGGVLYILRLIAKGPDTEEPPPRADTPPGTPLGAGVRGASVKEA